MSSFFCGSRATSARPPWSGGGGRYAIPDVLAEVKRHRTTLIFHNTRAQAELFFHDLWLANEEALPIIFDLVKQEGLCLGGSSGINVAGAIRLARELGPGKTVVTILADYGSRYQSKLFNPAFLRAKNLPVPAWLA